MDRDSKMSLEKMMVDQILETSRERIDFIHRELNASTNKAKFPLDLFNNFFAPYFFGDKQLSRDTDIFATWIGIAGSPMSSVDIINAQGQIEFTVPPLFDTNVIDILKKENLLNSVMDEYSNYSNTLPATAMNFVRNKLLPTADKALADTGHGENLSGWAKIAAYYDEKNPKPISTTTLASTNKSVVSNNDDDDLNYDV